MLTEVCQYLRNWFTRAQCYGEFTISNGQLQTQYDDGMSFLNVPLINGQYFRIIGSVLNDGVYKYPATGLKDEVFSGAVWTMGVPPAVLAIDKEIDEWSAKYNTADSAMLSPFQSESFGGYSYTKGGGGSSESGSSAPSWASVFGARLAPWRKI